MIAFSKDEQWYNDLDWFAVDKEGRIGHFTSVGWRLLPPSVAQNKEAWVKLFNYFDQLEAKNGFVISPNLDIQLSKKSIASFDRYIKSFAEMSSRGLYSYDSFDNSHTERPYYQVTIPETELRINDLPKEIGEILENIQISEVKFNHNSLISEDIVNKI